MSPVRAYVICGTPRSGSTLLCGLLEDAGCGVPESYFRRQSIAGLADELGVAHDGDLQSPDFSRRYLDAVIAAGRGRSETFGLRLMFENLDELSARLDGVFPGLKTMPERLERAFGPLLYIHLSREDKVAQAISLLKARQTGLWHVAADGSEMERTAPHRDAAYDVEAIAATVDQLTRHDEGWREWFSKHGIDPLSLTYNGLSRDPKAGLRSVLDALGLDPSRADGVAPQTSKLSDRQSEDWAARFRAEAFGKS